jgi:hypothetical protein
MPTEEDYRAPFIEAFVATFYNHGFNEGYTKNFAKNWIEGWIEVYLEVLREVLSEVCDAGTLASLEVKLRNINNPIELKRLYKLAQSDFNLAAFEQQVDEAVNASIPRL